MEEEEEEAAAAADSARWRMKLAGWVGQSSVSRAGDRRARDGDGRLCLGSGEQIVAPRTCKGVACGGGLFQILPARSLLKFCPLGQPSKSPCNPPAGPAGPAGEASTGKHGLATARPLCACRLPWGLP